MQDTESSLFDVAYRSVADQRRRRVLAFLRDTSTGTASLDDLVDHIVEQETNSPAPDRETVRIDLYHVHLPLLADTGAIDFDSHTETIRYRNQPSVETLLDGEFPAHADGDESEKNTDARYE